MRRLFFPCWVSVVLFAAGGSFAAGPDVPGAPVAPMAAADAMPAKAARYFSQLEKRPSNEVLFERFAEAWLGEKDLDSLAVFLSAHAEKAGGAAWAMVARLELRSGREAAALDALEKAIAADGKDPVLRLMRARQRLRALDVPAALVDLEVVRNDPADPVRALEATKLAGQALFRTGQTEKARAMWDDAVARAPEDMELLEDLAEAAAAEGETDTALVYLEELAEVTTDPYERTMRSLRRADVLQQGGRGEEALAAYGEILDRTGEGSWLEKEVLAGMERLFRRRDDAAGLIAHFQGLTTRYPARLNLRRHAARLLAANGQAAEAVAAYREILKQAPGQRESLLEFIRLLTDGDQLAEAATELEKLATREPADENLWLQLATLRHRLGQAEATGAALAKADALAKDKPGLALRLAAHCLQIGLKDDGEARLRALRDRPAEKTAATEMLAAHCQREGRTDEAIQLWTELASGPDLDPLLRSAQAIAGAGRAKEAHGLLLARANDHSADPAFLLALIQNGLTADAAAGVMPAAVDLVRLARQPADLKESIPLAISVARAANQMDAMIATLQAKPERSVPEICLLASLAEAVGNLELADQSTAGPVAAMVVYHRAALLRGRGDLPGAIAAMKSLADQPDGRGPAFWKELADLQRAAGEHEAALATIATWKQSAPNDRAAWLQEASVMEDLGRPDDAIPLLRRAVARFEGDVDLSGRLAAMLAQTGAWAEAESIYWRMHDDSDQPAARLRWSTELAKLAARSGRTEVLEDRLRERQRTDPKSPAPVLALAELARATNDTEKLRDLLMQAVRLQPKDIELRHRIAGVEEDAGNLDRAIAVLEETLPLDATPMTTEMLARCFLRNGETVRGLRLLRERGLGSKDARALERTLISLAEKSLVEEAVQLLRDQGREFAGDWRLQYLLGWMLEKDGRLDEAEAAYTAVLDARGDLAGVTALPSDPELGMYGSSLPPGTAELQRQISLLRLADVQGMNPYSWGSGGGTTIPMPDTAEAARIFAASRLHQLAQRLSDAAAAAIPARIARVIDPDLFAFVPRFMGGENDDSGQAIKEILRRRKDDKRILFLALQNNAAAADPEIRALMADAFSDSYPELVLITEFQAIAGKPDIAPEAIRTYFQRANELAGKTKDWPEMFLTMVGFSIAQHRGLINTGDGYKGIDDPVTAAAITELSARFSEKWRVWRASPAPAAVNPAMGIELRHLIDMVAWEILASDKQWAVMAAEMEATCNRHRGGPAIDPRMAMMAMQSGFGGHRLALDEKIPFPFSQVSSIPFDLSSRLLPQAAEGRDFFGLGGKSRGKEISDGLATVMDAISHPILRALIRQGQGDLAGMEVELAKVDESKVIQRLDAALLRASKAAEKNQPAETMTQLTLARAAAAAMPDLADSIDVWMLHAATGLDTTQRAASGLDARAALLRLARKIAAAQRPELAALATKLGESEVAARLLPRPSPGRPPDGVGGTGPAAIAVNPNVSPSGQAGPASASPKDRLTRLIDEGKTEAAAREAGNQLLPMVRDDTSRSGYQLKELVDKITAAKLVDAVIAHADPGGSKSLPKRREFTRVCLLFGRTDRALGQLESLAKDYPKDAAILMDLADALPMTEEARILQLWQQAAGDKSDLWVKRVEAIGNHSSAVEVITFWEKAALYLEKVVPAGESKRNLTWVNHGMVRLLNGVWQANLPGLAGHTSNDPTGLSPELLRRHQEVFGRVCQLMLRFPGTAEQGFQLLAAAQNLEPSEAVLDEAARRVLLSGMVRLKDSTRGGLWVLRTSGSGWSSSSGSFESNMLSSIEYLASRATKASDRGVVLPAAFLNDLQSKDAALAALLDEITRPLPDDAAARRLLAAIRKLEHLDAARLWENALFNRLPLTAASLDLVLGSGQESDPEQGRFAPVEFTGSWSDNVLGFFGRLHTAGQSELLESALLRLAEKELGPAAEYGKDRGAFSRKLRSFAMGFRAQMLDESFAAFAVGVYSRHRVPTSYLEDDSGREDVAGGSLRQIFTHARQSTQSEDERTAFYWRFFQDLGMIGVPAADFRAPVLWVWDFRAQDAASALRCQPLRDDGLHSYPGEQERKAFLDRLQALPNPGPGEALAAAIFSPSGERAAHLAAALARLGSAKTTARPEEVNAIGRMIDSLDASALDQTTVPASLRDNLRAHRAEVDRAAAEARKSLLEMVASDAFSADMFDEVVAVVLPMVSKDPDAAAAIFIAAEESLTRGMRSGRLPYLSRPYSGARDFAPLSDRDRLLESIIDDLPRINDPGPVLVFMAAVVKSPAGVRLQWNERLFDGLGRWLIACGIDNSDPSFQHADGHIPFLAARLLKADATTQAIAAAALTCRRGMLIRGHSDKASTQRLLKGLAQLRPNTPVFVDSIEFTVLATSTAAIRYPELATHLPDLAGRVLENPEVPVLLRAGRLSGLFNSNGAFPHRAGEFLPMITGLFREYGSGDRSAVTLVSTWELDDLFRGIDPRLPAKDLLPLAEAWHTNITSPKAGGHPPLASNELKVSLLLGAFAGHQALVDAHAAMAPDALLGDYAMLVALADAGMTTRIPDFLPKPGGTFHVAKDPIWTAGLEKRWAVMRDAVGPEFFARVDAYAAARSDATGASAPSSPWNVRRDMAIAALRANPPQDPMGRLGALNMLSGNFANAVLILPEMKAAVADLDRPALAKELAMIATSGQASRDAITRLRVLDAAAGAGIFHGDPDPLLVALSLYQDLVATIRKSPDARDALVPGQIHVLLDRNLRLASNVLLGVTAAVARPDSRAALAACLPALEQLAVEAHYWPRNGPSPEGRAVLAATLAAQALGQGQRIPPLATKVQPACTGEFKKIATGDAPTRLLESVGRIDDWKSAPFTPHRRAYQQWMLDGLAQKHPKDVGRVQGIFRNGQLSVPGDIEAALAHVPADAPTRGALLLALAREWQARKNPAEAEKAFRQAIAANDAGGIDAVLALADHFQRGKKPGDALAVLEAADTKDWPQDRKKQFDGMMGKLKK